MCVCVCVWGGGGIGKIYTGSHSVEQRRILDTLRAITAVHIWKRSKHARREEKLVITESVKPEAVERCCMSLDLARAQANARHKLLAINSKR